MSRRSEHERISALAGLSAEGAILPPPKPFGSIDRTRNALWRNPAAKRTPAAAEATAKESNDD